MSTEDNKALVRRFYEEINQHTLAAVDQLCAPNFVLNGHTQGIEGFKQVLSTYFITAVPDIQMTIEDMIAEGEKVAARLTLRGTHAGDLWGIPPTGKQATISSINIWRVVGGKLVEQWSETDMLGMMQQLGVIPPQG